MTNLELSVVIPTYREKENLEILVPRIMNVFSESKISGEVVVVDDQSDDGTDVVLHSMSNRYSNFQYKIRAGEASLASSWYEGFDMAQACCVVCIDADLCHDPNYFPAMLELMKTYDIVIGSRYSNHQNRMQDKSVLAAWLSIISQYLSRTVTGFNEKDISHSFRMFRKEVFDEIKHLLTVEGNSWLILFLFLAKQHGFSVYEYPIDYGKRIYGETKLHLRKEGFRYLKLLGKIIVLRCSHEKSSYNRCGRRNR